MPFSSVLLTNLVACNCLIWTASAFGSIPSPLKAAVTSSSSRLAVATIDAEVLNIHQDDGGSDRISGRDVNFQESGRRRAAQIYGKDKLPIDFDPEQPISKPLKNAAVDDSFDDYDRNSNGKNDNGYSFSNGFQDGFFEDDENYFTKRDIKFTRTNRFHSEGPQFYDDFFGPEDVYGDFEMDNAYYRESMDPFDNYFQPRQPQDEDPFFSPPEPPMYDYFREERFHEQRKRPSQQQSQYYQQREDYPYDQRNQQPRRQSPPSTSATASNSKTTPQTSNTPPTNSRFTSKDPYLGQSTLTLFDSTLYQISRDYSIPLPHLGDILSTFTSLQDSENNHPPSTLSFPIDPYSRLSDILSGEQAFEILEIIHTLDMAALHDSYSEDSLMNVCEYHGLDLGQAYEFGMERGWCLPFGVRSFLRLEWEEELLEAFRCGEMGCEF
mmetsp:Transcript_26333/g.54939  ORF Transcript_26333/g.54939 Transcript_26333/m.54939 type:complete len:438 (-) Transcript_26333:398-1711(-)